VDIVVDNLVKNYFLNGQTIEVLKGLSFSIKQGEFISLTGPSGIGKSTLLHILGTLDSPSSGSLIFSGEDVFARGQSYIARFRNENIGFVFQFHHLLPEFSALENVMLPLLVRRSETSRTKKIAEEMLDDVGLSHRVHHKPGELSGGEQQRVALARSLVNRPRLLLADEPTGNLDEKTGTGVFDLMQRVNKNLGVSVLLVTHNEKLAARATRKMVLSPSGII